MWPPRVYTRCNRIKVCRWVWSALVWLNFPAEPHKRVRETYHNLIYENMPRISGVFCTKQKVAKSIYIYWNVYTISDMGVSRHIYIYDLPFFASADTTRKLMNYARRRPPSHRSRALVVSIILVVVVEAVDSREFSPWVRGFSPHQFKSHPRHIRECI